MAMYSSIDWYLLFIACYRIIAAWVVISAVAQYTYIIHVSSQDT